MKNTTVFYLVQQSKNDASLNPFKLKFSSKK